MFGAGDLLAPCCFSKTRCVGQLSVSTSFFASRRVDQSELAVSSFVPRVFAKDMILISSSPGPSKKCSHSFTKIKGFLHLGEDRSFACTPRTFVIFHLRRLLFSWWFLRWAWPCRSDLQRCTFRRMRGSASQTFWYCFIERNLWCGSSPDRLWHRLGGRSFGVSSAVYTEMVPLVPRFLVKKRSATKMGLTEISKTNAAEKLHSTSRDTKTSRRHQQGHTQNENKKPPSTPSHPNRKKPQNTQHENRVQESDQNKPVCCSPQLLPLLTTYIFPLLFSASLASHLILSISSVILSSSALSHGFVFFD